MGVTLGAAATLLPASSCPAGGRAGPSQRYQSRAMVIR